MQGGFAYPTSYTLTPGQPPPGLDYLPASPHRLPPTTLDRRLAHSPSPHCSPPPLHPAHDAPLPITVPVGGTYCNDTTSAVRLSPATLSARNHLTSELLRTLSRVAASKPTSWLSLRLHILSHLAYA